MSYHAAVVHPDDKPDTYCGVVSDEHVAAVLARCEVDPDRWPVRGRDGGLYVLRDDGDLDHYLPVGPHETAPAENAEVPE